MKFKTFKRFGCAALLLTAAVRVRAGEEEAFQARLERIGAVVAAVRAEHRFRYRDLFSPCIDDEGRTGFNDISIPELLSSRNGECAKLSHAGLAGLDLRGINLQGADLTSASLADSNLEGADLSGTHLFTANLSRADMAGAFLNYLDMNGATLTGATLRGAQILVSNLKGSDMRNVDFEDADLRYSDLRNSDVAGSDFRGALYNDMTRLPFERGLAQARGMKYVPLQDVPE